MPYHVDAMNADCDGFAVVKDDDGTVLGCHRTQGQAERQMAALYASEADQEDDDAYEMDEERADPVAPKEDQIEGSSKNDPGSASDKSGDISLSAETETALDTKASEHNQKMTDDDRPNWTRVRVGALRSVYRRGSGAFSGSHRPGIGRAQWSMARVNAFLFLARTGRPNNPKYVGDNDLLHSDHPRYSEQKREASFSPNQAMRNEAKFGLKMREEYGRGGTEVGVARARDIANGSNLSLDTVKRMVSFFARHEVDKKGKGFTPDQEGYPSAGRIAWALWGGDPGRSWAERIVAQTRGLNTRDLDASLEWSDKQVILHETLHEIVEKTGLFEKDVSNNGAHYNQISPFSSSGIVCANCVFYMGGQKCAIVAGNILPGGICKFWIINETLLTITKQETPKRNEISEMLASWNLTD